ncbi:MAG TPA: sensor domain-containing diguanylate cyclase [Actinomycetes bacterium]|nr:sensor domain-containing diguanylate cyclase [Actinomycetes bacterium]
MVRRRLLQNREPGALGSDAEAKLAALTEIIRVVGSAKDYDSLLLDAARAARIAMGGASVSISRWERGQGQVRVLVNEGALAEWEVERPQDEVYSVRRDQTLTDLVVQGQGFVVDVGRPTHAHWEALLLESGKVSAVDVPIVVEGQVWGDLWVARATGEAPFTDDDLEYATVVAAQVATAIAAGERLARVSRLAYTDPLTGLANRRAVDDRLDAALEQHELLGHPASLLVCDVNGLKLINDERGHEAGDRALIQFAGVLSASSALAPGSLAARLGGDEFCIVMDGHSGDRAVEVADDLSRRAAQILPHGVSCGVASTDDDVGQVRSPGRLFRLADAAQYRAKRSRSRRPVVAGRSLPVQAASLPSDGAERTDDRRQLRGRGRSEQGRVLETGIASLDDISTALPGARIECVADTLGRHVDAAGWWVSSHPRGSDIVRTVSYAVYRTATTTPGVGTMSSDEIGAEFPLAQFPLTQAALAGAAHLVTVDDPYADAAEAAIVQGMGCISLLVAGGTDSEGDGWLIEVFGDEISVPMNEIVPVARALVAMALTAPFDHVPS